MRLLERDSQSLEEKKSFFVYQHNEIDATGVSSDLQLINSPKSGVHILLNRTTSPGNTPINQHFSESTLSFTETQNVSLSAHGRKFQQNTLNIFCSFILF